MHAVRCCSDEAISGWDKVSTCQGIAISCNVWAESLFGSTSYAEMNFEKANQICSENGGRLCTQAELVSGCSCDTGGGHNHRMVWSSTSSHDQGKLCLSMTFMVK